MAQTVRDQWLRDPYSPGVSSRRINRILLLALFLSLLLHTGFGVVSHLWLVNDPSRIQQDIETLFNVEFQQLESQDFVSRPTNVQMREAREQALESQLAELAQAIPREAGVELEGDALRGNAASPQWRDDSVSDYINDQPARNVITSDMGRMAIDELERSLGADSVDTGAVGARPVSLTGRGTGSGRRLIADLPAPLLNDQPLISRRMQTDLAPRIPAIQPELGMEGPPVELPPVSELLPTPDLFMPLPAASQLGSEQVARDEIKDRFVQLDDLLQVDLFVYRHAGGDGYFKIRIRPQRADDRLQVLPKDVVLVVDASRSMGSRRLRAIKNEVAAMLDRLRPDDRFNVVGFKQRVSMFTDSLAEVTPESIEEAQEFIQPLESSGHTDIYQSLEPLVELGVERARPLSLLLFSDGRPTVGVRNSRNIINSLTSKRGPSTSIFCVGTGNQINRYLLDMLAFRNRGLVAFEPRREFIERSAQALFSYIEDPVLLQIRPDFSNLNDDEVYPKVLPDLYMRGELNIWGRMQNQAEITLRLVGEAFDEQKEMIKTIPVPANDNGTFDLAREWANHKIYHLVGRMVEEGETPELLEEIRQLSLTYNVVTPYSDNL